MSQSKIRNLQSCETANNICRGDCCVAAVQRAYQELLASGQAEILAFDAAMTVFNWHHPEISGDDASVLVRGWVQAGTPH